jgi:hypothetical protein
MLNLADLDDERYRITLTRWVSDLETLILQPE